MVTSEPTAVPAWRRWLVVVGAAIGLVTGFISLFFSTLPFFLLPLSGEFGWSRTETTAAATLSMLGTAMGAPLAGWLFTRFGTERTIGISISLFAVCLFSLTSLPNNLFVFGALCFATGLTSSGTTPVGYLSVLPKWFDARLGLALGLAGIGAGAGVGLAPFIATSSMAHFGWRGTYASLAALAAVGGLVAWLLISVRGTLAPNDKAAHPGSSEKQQKPAERGVELREALADWRLWLLLIIVFLSTFSILGIIVHSATLASDRGLTIQQAAVVASVAGVGGLFGRVVVGALLDRFFAPAIAVGVFALAAIGLFLNSDATTFFVIATGACLSGIAFGAEGDLMPFFVRRYFGAKAFGLIFGLIYVAYTLGGVFGPVAYGFVYDRTGDYLLILRIAAAACAFCAVTVLLLGSYRFHTKQTQI
jgi:OFA family oxalate/formate antiporter-like MFS transporter